MIFKDSVSVAGITVLERFAVSQVLASIACALLFIHSTAALADRARPFRIGVHALDPGLDRAKPLATADSAGFTVNSGLVIGAFNRNWVGALSLEHNDVQWWLETKAELTTPPGSFGSHVVLGFRDGTVKKVEALTGTPLWSASLESFSQRPFTLSGTTLMVFSAAQVLHALDFQTGKTLWLYDAGFPDGLAIRGGVRPTVNEGQVLLGISSGEVLAVNMATGKLAWRYNPSYSDAQFHDIVGEMVVYRSRVIVSRFDGLVAAISLNSATREVAWSESLPGLTTSAFRNGRFYVGASNGDVFAIDANDGRRIWRQETGEAVGSLTVGETTVFVGGGDGRVTALDTLDGAVRWHDDLSGDIASAPILVEGSIYFATGIKALYGYKLH